MRRGLTMVETLVSLSILSALLLVVAAWTRVATQAGATAAEAARWELAAEAVMDLIHVDLASGDASRARSRRGRARERVEVEDGVLRIRTRPTGVDDVRGQAVHRYVLSDKTLRREHDADDDIGRPLMDDVDAWSCVIDNETRLLSATITDREGRVVGRVFRLP